MDTKKETRGRPPIANRRTRLAVTMADDDLDVLRRFAALTGSRPATVIREVMTQAIPDIKELVEAAECAKVKGVDRVKTRGAAILAKHIRTAAEIQQDLFHD